MVSHDSPGGWVRTAVALPETASAGPLQLSLQPHVSVSGRVALQDDAAARGVSLPSGLTVRITPEQLMTGDSVSPGIVQPDGTFVVSRVVPGRRYFVRVTQTPPWRQTAGSVYGQDAFSVPVTITKGATDARIVITDR